MSLDELYRQLAAQPLGTLTGIVSASGSGGGISPGRSLWSFTFAFVAWRLNGGEINNHELIVRRPATREELTELTERVAANTVITVRARVAMQNVFRRPEALLEEIIGEDDTDPELNDCLAELLKPVIYSDEDFGDLLLDRSVTTFAAQTVWNGAPVELRLWLDEVEELPAALRHAREFWASSSLWNKRVLDCIARDCLPLKSENWQEDDGSPVSREQFEQRISLRSITIRADGDFEVWYNDGDLFFGHDIMAQGKINGEQLSAGIHG